MVGEKQKQATITNVKRDNDYLTEAAAETSEQLKEIFCDLLKLFLISP